MGLLSRVFVVAVVVADLFAVVYFGGRILTTGSIFPVEPVHQEVDPALLAAVPAREPEPAFDRAAFVADPVKGQRVSAKCKACHTFEAGGKHRTGPNMWGIYGAGIAHVDDFSYSAAFENKKGELVWDEATLDAYLLKPKEYIPGTKMAFPGIRDIEDRLNLIAWLKTLKD